MITWKTISDEDARNAIDKKEFSDSIRGSRDRVAVILTQAWCPQWASLKHSLDRIADSEPSDIDIYMFIYDRSPLFREFLEFKENVWENDLIPYVRYYRNGELRGESNFLGVPAFLNHFNDAAPSV
jgi:hypothetical protein